MPTTLVHRSCLLALLALGACSWLCPDPSCPNSPQSEALVPEAKHRITVKTLDDAALTRAVCLVQANDGPACEAGVDPPVCDKRPAGEVRAKLKPAFDVLRDYKFTSATVAAADIPKRLPASWATTAVHDARRNKDCHRASRWTAGRRVAAASASDTTTSGSCSARTRPVPSRPSIFSPVATCVWPISNSARGQALVTHDQILNALRAVFPEQAGAQPAIRLLARCKDDSLGLPARSASVFVPDMHMLGNADAAAYPRYHFTDQQDRDLQQALAALADLRDADPFALNVYQIGDLFDFWRTRGGRDPKTEVSEIAADHAEIVDLLRDRLEARILAGNHDYICHLLDEWRAARFFIMRGEAGGGDILILHGDELDWAERLAPDAAQAAIVKIARGIDAPTQAFDTLDADAASTINRSLPTGDAAIGPAIATYSEPGAIGSFLDDVSFAADLASLPIGDTRTRFFRQAAALSRELAALGHDVGAWSLAIPTAAYRHGRSRRRAQTGADGLWRVVRPLQVRRVTSDLQRAARRHREERAPLVPDWCVGRAVGCSGAGTLFPGCWPATIWIACMQMANVIAVERKVQQQNALQAWLKHAPTPLPRGSNSYDVFISYRSTDRAWAMALYDVLKLAGWEAFLDQYDLVPGSNLETSLTEGLEASSSGVILWSSRTKDSDWCKQERNAMRALKARPGSTFNYIFGKLDAEPLPLFAQADLYVDFEESPEGPRGVNLLRLMCGLRGIPLAPEAVVLAEQVDQNATQSLAKIKGAIEAGHAAKLLEIATSPEPGVLASPAPILTAAQGLIRLGKYDDAREVLAHALAHFPKSIRAKQLEGLALRRLKRYQEAIDVLSELKEAGHQDPETMGILAAAWDGLYQESRKKLHLRKSRALYRTAFQSDPKDYYTGVNAASKSLFLGEVDEAVRLAGLVLPLVAKAIDGNDFRAACTLGEVHLLQRNIEAAAAQYQTVVDNHPSRRR